MVHQYYHCVFHEYYVWSVSLLIVLITTLYHLSLLSFNNLNFWKRKNMYGLLMLFSTCFCIGISIYILIYLSYCISIVRKMKNCRCGHDVVNPSWSSSYLSRFIHCFVIVIQSLFVVILSLLSLFIICSIIYWFDLGTVWFVFVSTVVVIIL